MPAPTIATSRILPAAEIQSVSIMTNGIETLWSNGVIYNSGPAPIQVFSGPTTSTTFTESPIVILPGNGTMISSGLNRINPRISVTTGTSSTYFNGVGGSITSNWIVFPGMYQNTEALERHRLIQIKRRAEKVQAAKGAIKRALKLMDNFGFGDDARVFLGGNSVEVSHPDSIFKFVLTKRSGSVIDKTINPGYSTPYVLELYTKTDVHVANLCVYMEDTPLLDQVLALTMFIKSGDENHILETANWFKLRDDPQLMDAICMHNPALAQKVRRINFYH